MRVRIQFHTLCSRTARHEIAVLLTLVLLPMTVQALDDWQPLPTGEMDRIAFGSCAKQWEPQPIWNGIAAAEPDLFLFIGDAIYGDWHGEKPFTPTAESLRADWNRLGAQPAFQALRRRMPVLATWDNHDYGSHNGGVEFPLKQIARKEFLDFFGEPRESKRRSTPGIHTARILGPDGRRVQIILLDTKWFRSGFEKDPRTAEERTAIGKVGKYVANEAPDATVLGEAQWRWLEEQLRQPADVRLIVSSTQIVSDEKGMDEWGAFPRERERLFRLIAETDAKGAVLLSGNVHFAELSVWNDGSYPLYDLTASGMTHVNPAYAAAENRYRVAGPFVENNFGLVMIDWDATPSPTLTLQARGADGRVGFVHEISLGELQ
jgi:alkaline phosphatase D